MSDDEKTEISKEPSSIKEAPTALRVQEVMAKGYMFYMRHLKGGGNSRISSILGRAADILPEAVSRPAPPAPPPPVPEPLERASEQSPLPEPKGTCQPSSEPSTADLGGPNETPAKPGSAELEKQINAKSTMQQEMEHRLNHLLRDKEEEEVTAKSTLHAIEPSRFADQPAQGRDRLEMFTSRALLETGLLQNIFNLARRDWNQSKLLARDPCELAQEYERRLEQLNKQYHENGVLTEEYSILGFMLDSESIGGERLLIKASHPDHEALAYTVDPSTGKIVGEFKIKLKDWAFSLEQVPDRKGSILQ